MCGSGTGGGARYGAAAQQILGEMLFVSKLFAEAHYIAKLMTFRPPAYHPPRPHPPPSHPGNSHACPWQEVVNAAYLERVDLSAHGFYATPDVTGFGGNYPFNYLCYGGCSPCFDAICLLSRLLVLLFFHRSWAAIPLLQLILHLRVSCMCGFSAR